MNKRKILAISGGVVFALLGVIIAFLGQFVVAIIGDLLVAKEALPGYGLPNSNDNFYFYFVLSTCLSAGLCITAFFWQPRKTYALRRTIYIILLITILPITVFNYAHADMLINRSAQLLMNIALVFLGSVIAWELASIKAQSKDFLVVQLMSIFAIAFTSVFFPITYSIVWLLNALGAITNSQASTVTWPPVAALSGVCSTVITYLKYRNEKKGKEKNLIIT